MSEIDIKELGAQLRARRGRRGLREIAKEIGDVSASTLSRVEKGKVPDLDTFVRLCRWLGLAPEHFMDVSKQKGVTGSTKDVVVAHLRAERTLDPKTVEALVGMINLAFNSLPAEEVARKKKG
jgi:transcriptional regulator with XRE-family HTH domain